MAYFIALFKGIVATLSNVWFSFLTGSLATVCPRSLAVSRPPS